MRRSKKPSVRIEVVSLLAFIVVLVGYSVFSSLSISGQSMPAQANVDAAGNLKCATRWDQLFQTALKEGKTEGDAKNEANAKNMGFDCTGKCKAACDFGPTSPDKVKICRGDGGNAGCEAASDDGAKKAMEDAAKMAKDLADKAKGEEKGGGAPPIPSPKEPKPKDEPQPKDCVDGKTSSLGTPCKAKSDPASFDAENKGAFSGLLDSFKKAFGLDDQSGTVGGLTPEEELQRIADSINQDPQIAAAEKPERIEAMKNYIEAVRAVGNHQSVNALLNTNRHRPIEEIQEGTRTLQAEIEAAGGDNPLVPSGDFTPQETNIINRVFSWLKDLF